MPTPAGRDPRDATEGQWRTLELPTVIDPRGKLTFIEGGRHAPFPIRRAYWIYDVPGGEVRGGHAFRLQEELLIALSGSFDVLLDDGTNSGVVHLNRSYHGVYVPRMTWRKLENFSTNGVCMVLASAPYAEEDYLRDYDAFRALTRTR
jgi:dTDP-4-dehydrorhamnose 3,5-epimerase-like enzyme